MPFVLLFSGIILLVVSIRNQQTPFVHLIGGDFTGPGNFIYWVVALVVVGSIGYIPKAKPVSNLLLALIIIVLVLKRGNPSANVQGGVFEQLVNALKTTNTSSAASTAGAAAGGIVQQLTGTGG